MDYFTILLFATSFVLGRNRPLFWGRGGGERLDTVYQILVFPIQYQFNREIVVVRLNVVVIKFRNS